MKSTLLLYSLGWASATIMQPKSLDVDDTRSIRNVAATIAHDTMAYYTGNVSSSDPKAVGNVQRPYYWWVAGALWGLMIDYYHVTKDPSYNDVILQALLAKVNLGPDNNYLPPEHSDEEGNDDLFFWGNAVLTAAEINFPQPNKDLPSWLDISKNVFTWLESRWDTKNCDGGVFWQILASNPNGLNYKNAISNGGFFQLAARLARATNDDIYVQWAEKIWDWSWDHNLIDHDNYHVYDGVDIRTQCKEVNPASFTYLSGIYLSGAAVMANHTGKAEWADRAEKLLDGAGWFFFTDGDSKNVMNEGACESIDSCFKGNADMSTFKGYLADLMWKSAVMLPSLRSKVAGWLIPTAKAAAQSCQGGQSGTQCGMKWSTGGFDGTTNLGPQMNALGAVQGLLIEAAAPPMQGNGIIRVSDASFPAVDPNREDPKPTTTTTTTTTSTSDSTSTPTPTTTSIPPATASSDGSTSTPAPSSSSSTQEPSTTTPESSSETSISSGSSESSTFITSTASSLSDTPTSSEASETSNTESSELQTSTSCTSRTATTYSTATDITLTLEPTLSSTMPTSYQSISTFFSMPNYTNPGTGLPFSSGLTHSIATLPSPTGSNAASSLGNHVPVAMASAFGAVMVTWLL